MSTHLPDSGATLSVSDSGVVEGSVAVPNVVLNGAVKGDILAHERVELGATAKVTGNVYYALIEMEMGAEINGKLIHEPRKAATSEARFRRKRPAARTQSRVRSVNALTACRRRRSD